jgi:hypothetical protein
MDVLLSEVGKAMKGFYPGVCATAQVDILTYLHI